MRESTIKIAVITLCLIILDQFSKSLATLYLKTPFQIINNFFEFKYAENTGIAFSMPVPFLLLIISNIILIILVIYLASKEIKIDEPLSFLGISMIIGGGISNLIDRIASGFVVDFISIWLWPSFNLADIYITVGILLIVVFYGKIKKVHKPHNNG